MEFCSDQGTEFKSGTVAKMLAEAGVTQTFSNVRDPTQNGISERSNRILIELGRTQLIASGLPTRLWDQSILFAAEILNATTIRKDVNKSAFEIFLRKKPFSGKIYPFGTKCYYLNQNPTLKKMQPRGREGVLVGLNSGVFGYRIRSSDTNTLVTTKHVTFSKKSPLLTAEE